MQTTDREEIHVHYISDTMNACWHFHSEISVTTWRPYCSNSL